MASRSALALLASLLVLGALNARAQDDPEPTPGQAQPIDEDDDGRIVITAHGHAEAISSGVTLEYIIRVPGEDAADAQKKFDKKMKSLVKAMEEEAPVTTLVRVETHWAPKFQANGFVFKPNFGSNPPFKAEVGATFTNRFFVGIHDLGKVSPDLARKRIAQVLNKLGENELTGAEDNTDIIAAHMELDLEALKAKSEADAMERARTRAAALAKLSGRKLGRATLLQQTWQVLDHEQVKWGSNYFNFVFPGNSNGWTASLTVSCDTEIQVSFDLD